MAVMILVFMMALSNLSSVSVNAMPFATGEPPSALDTTFDADGKLITDFSGYELGESLAFQSDGKIIVAGGAWNGSNHDDFALARYVGNQTFLTVTKTADTNDGVCDSDCSLREAIEVAVGGETINFDSSLAGQTITLSSTLVIGKALTIDGSALVSKINISGGNSVCVFQVGSTVTVEMHYLNIINGYSLQDGSGIENQGTLTLTNSNVSNNTADHANGAIFNRGGATLTVIDSTFSNNVASPDGGAIKNDTGGTLTITNSTFSGNSANLGGALNNWSGATMTVTGSTFTNNSSGMGGSIMNQGTLTISDSTLSGNSAIDGGAIFNTGGNLILTNTTLSANDTAHHGGAIYNANSGSVTIQASILADNVVTYGQGGAIWNGSGGLLTVTHSTFTSNLTSGLEGGGIFNRDAMATITNSVFASNSTGPVGGYGGGVMSQGPSAVLNLYNNTFSGNGAEFAGGVHHFGGTLNLKNTIIANSTNGDCVSSGGTFNGDHNLIEDAANACGLTNGVNGNIIGSDPNLGAPTGFPAYFPLNSGSPAIDAGNDATCAAMPVNNESQNGVVRPRGALCDIGAYEFEGETTAPTVISIVRAGANHTSAASVDFTVTFSESVLDVDANAFTLNVTGGISGATLGSVTGSGATRTVSVNTGTGNGTLGLIVPVGATINDLVGNPIGGLPFTSGEIYTILKTATFSDVSTGYWAWPYVERLYNAGITGGCNVNPLQYCPDGTATRAQMAVFLLRGIHGSSYNPPAAEGITGGCGNRNYCPETSVTRAQMAVFLLRSKYGASYSPPAVGGSTGFTDVDSTHWADAWIKQLVSEGITAGCGNGNYCPEAPVTRAQMAVFLVRTFNFP